MDAPPRLMPGLRLVRRDPDHLQLGVDPPHRVVLRDLPEVRRLVAGLVVGHHPDRPSHEAALALRDITEAGLLLPDPAERRAGLAAVRVRVDAPPDMCTAVTALLEASGLTVRSRGPVDLALVASDGEIARSRLDPLVRDEVPHLLVRAGPAEVVVGPFVAVGLTACLRCVDCHLGDEDPRRALVVEQAATQDPLVVTPTEPSLRAVALALAVRDLVTFAEGDPPSTWSATTTVDRRLDLVPRRWLRHPACGCAWDALARTG